MKITATVKELIEMGIIPNNCAMRQHPDSLVELMSSVDELKGFVEKYNSDKKDESMQNIAYAMDIGDLRKGSNIAYLEVHMIPEQFFSKEGIDESKIDIDKILREITGEEIPEKESFPDSEIDDILAFIAATILP